MLKTLEIPFGLERNSSESSRWTLRLEGAAVAWDARRACRADVEIAGSRTSRILRQGFSGPRELRAMRSTPATRVDLEGYMLLPGLVNAHDHLELNLFPRLGRGPYANAVEWARDIYHPDLSPLREHLSVPKPLRLWWGGLKNLLSGVTSVCHHNPYEEDVFNADFPIRVVKRFGWTHSLGFGKNIAEDFLKTPAKAPFILHLGEGTDQNSEDEIFDLDRLGALTSRTVIVHGVGLTAEGHALRRQRDAALVWCPTSNRFILGKTLDVRDREPLGRLALGSDSALSAQGDLLDEINHAHRIEGADPHRIYSLVTESAAAVLRLRNGEGTIREGAIADLVAVRQEDATPGETLAGADFTKIELVMVSGMPHLVSPRMAQRWPEELLSDLETIEVEGTVRLVRAPVKRMLRETQKCLSGKIRLAGKQLAA